MSETLLDIITATANELLLEPPAFVIGNTDEFTRGMLSMATAAGRDLVRRHEWGALMTLASVPTVVGQSDYLLPTDFYRMVGDTSWDTSTNWRVGGPITPQMEQYLRDSTAGLTNIYRSFRQIGSKSIRVTPTPPDATGVIAFLYMSRNWVLTNGGPTTAQIFSTDADTTIFDFDLMVKETKWRWRSAKGFDAAEARQERDDALMALMAADQGGGTLNMGPVNDDPGGWVIAGTTPNFRLSDGSGNSIVID